MTPVTFAPARDTMSPATLRPRPVRVRPLTRMPAHAVVAMTGTRDAPALVRARRNRRGFRAWARFAKLRSTAPQEARKAARVAE